MRGTSTSELFSASADPAISFEDTTPNLKNLFSLGGHLRYTFAALSTFTSICNLVVWLVGLGF